MPVGPSSGRGRKSVDYSQKWGFMRGFMGHAIVISEWYTDFGLPAFLKLQNLERKVIINEIDTYEIKGYFCPEVKPMY